MHDQRMRDQLEALGPQGRHALKAALEQRALSAQGPQRRAGSNTGTGAGTEARLVAYVVLAPEAGGDAVETLAAALRADLPEYLVPAHIVPLAELPRTANGKLDRHALPAPSRASAEGGTAGLTGFVAPASDAEIALARVWSEVLGLDEIGVDDHFFELGGHSLLVNQVVARIHDVFGVELPLRTVFDAPTLAGLSVAVENALIAELSGAPAG